MPIGRLFFEIGGDTSRLNASLQEAVRIAQDAGVKVTRAGQSIISAFDEALNPTKKLAEQVKLLEAAGKSASDIWQVMGDRMKTAADAARANSQAVDPLVQKHIDLAKASQGSASSFESLGKIIQDFSQNPVEAAKSGVSSLLGALGPTAVGIGAVGSAAIAAGVAVFKLAENAGETAEQIKNLSYATGMTVEDVQALQRLGQERGLGDLTGMIEKLNAQLGSKEGGSFTEAILRMGIAIKEGAGATYYLEELRKHYAEIPDATKRAEQAAADLGKRLIHELGPAILNVDESITDGMDAIKKSGAVMSDEQIESLKKLKEQIEEHGRTWQWLKNQISIAASEATLAFMKMVEAFGSQPVLKDSSGKMLTDNNGVPLTPNPYWNVQSTAKSQLENIPFVGPKMPDLGENELAKRSREIAEADALAAGTKQELINLTIRLNELEKEYSEEKSKQKGLAFDADRLKSLASQIANTKELIKEDTDLGKLHEKQAKDAEEALKKLASLNHDIAKIQDKIDTTGHAALVPSQNEIDSYLKKFDKETLDRVKTYEEVESRVTKEISTNRLEELKAQRDIITNSVPMNDREREQMNLEKAHIDYMIKAEEIRVKYEQIRMELQTKLNKLSEEDPLRKAAEADLGKLGEKERQELEQAGKVFSNDVLKVHREEYKKMITAVRDGAGEIFDILTSSGKDKFQSLLDWFKGTFMSGLKKIFQNFFEEVVTGFQNGLGGIFSGIIPQSGGNIQGAMSMAGSSNAYGSTIPSQFKPGTVYAAGAGGTFAMDYYASLNGGSFVVPESSSTKSSMWGSMLGSGSKGMDWGTFFGGGENGFFGSEGSPGFLGSGTGGINGKGVGGTFGGMLMGGGMSLFMDSLSRKGVGAWAEAIGGGAMTGFALGGPLGAGIGAGAGLLSRLIKLAMGKNAYEAGSMEVSRDFGGISVSEDQLKTYLSSKGISESQAYPNRKNIESSPDFLKNIGWEAAQAQGKTEEFLKSLEMVGTSWGDFNFRGAFDIGRLTGDWTALNKAWEDSKMSDMTGIGADISKGLEIDATTLKPYEQLIVDLDDLKKSVTESIPTVKSMYETFLETGEITQDLRDQVAALGGDISAFEQIANLTQLNNDFDDMVSTFRETGEILPGLRQMFIDFGGDLTALDAAGALPGLHDALTFMDSLQSGLANLVPELDPIKALLSGKWTDSISSALSGAGLDPSKFEGLSGLIGMEQNWSKIAVPFTTMTADLKKALLTYGGDEGKLAVENYGKGLNTITQGLLDSTKEAMDEAYQAAVQDALDYIGDAQTETSDKITTLTTAVEDQFTIVSENITDAITDAKKAVVDALEKLILAAAYKGETSPASAVQDTSDEGASTQKFGDIPQASGGGLVEVHDSEAILDREQTRNLLRGGARGTVVNLINPVIYGFQDFVEQVRRAGLDLQRRGDPQWA